MQNNGFCPSWIAHNWHRYEHPFWQHVYLTVVAVAIGFLIAASLALLRHRAWWWLAWLSLAGAVGYVALWVGSVADPETPVVAIYLLVLFGLFVAFRRGISRRTPWL